MDTCLRWKPSALERLLVGTISMRLVIRMGPGRELPTPGDEPNF